MTVHPNETDDQYDTHIHRMNTQLSHEHEKELDLRENNITASIAETIRKDVPGGTELESSIMEIEPNYLVIAIENYRASLQCFHCRQSETLYNNKQGTNEVQYNNYKQCNTEDTIYRQLETKLGSDWKKEVLRIDRMQKEKRKVADTE